MAEIRWTSEAETWLRDIHNYIANDNPHAAMRVAQAIYRKYKHYENSPTPVIFTVPKMKEKYGFCYTATIALHICVVGIGK